MLLLLAQLASAAPPESVARFLNDPVTELKAERVPRGFWPIVISNVAEGCASLGQAEADACIRAATKAALSPAVTGWTQPPNQLGSNGLALAHLGLTLAVFDHITGEDTHDALRGRIAEHLAAKSLRDATFIAASYAGQPQRYPADQAVVLHFLVLHDALEHTHLAAAPTAGFLVSMASAGTDAATGLYVSERTGAEAWSAVPRGCAATWTARYLATAAPEAAQAQWDATMTHLGSRQFGMLGIREWPVGREYPADVDSGPIVEGIGAAATGFGIGAADRLGDDRRRFALQNTASLVRTMAPLAGGEVAEAANNLLGDALTFGNTAGRWWE